MFGLFGRSTKKEDTEEAQMLLVTFASYKKTCRTMSRDFLLGTIKGYPGINVMSERPGELMFQYPNEFSPFTFVSMSAGEVVGVSAVSGPPYEGLSVSVGLKEGGGFIEARGWLYRCHFRLRHVPPRLLMRRFAGVEGLASWHRMI